MNQTQIKIDEAEIDGKEPWKDDELKRKELADRLTDLLEYQKDALTISINGKWGSGKTFLLKRWRQDLVNQGYSAIYFNAWEDDFLIDPLMSIIGQMWNELKKPAAEEIFQKLKAAAVPLLKNVGLSLLNSGIQKITGINCRDLNETEIKTTAEKTLDSYIQMISSRDELKQCLQELANSNYNQKVLDINTNQVKAVKKPLIFIVDELDRCRPTFAVEMLERIKHLFSLRHVIFVLGIDREQLGKSIQAVYGDIDVDNYLHRLIDLEFCIPETDPRLFFEALWKRYDIDAYLTEKSSNKNDNFELNEGVCFKQGLQSILVMNELSLRKIEQMMKLYVLLLQNTSGNNCSWPYLAPILIFLKIKKPEIYRKYINDQCLPGEIIEAVASSRKEKGDMHSLQVILAVVYVSFLSEDEMENQEKKIRDALEKLKNYDVSIDPRYCPKFIIECGRDFCSGVFFCINKFKNIIFGGQGYNIESFHELVKKIDFYNPIKYQE